MRLVLKQWSKILSAFAIQIPQTGRPRFFATLVIFFLIAFVYDILRSAKISLVISNQDAGAEIIPFISIWGILPASFLLTFLFTLNNKTEDGKSFHHHDFDISWILLLVYYSSISKS